MTTRPSISQYISAKSTRTSKRFAILGALLSWFGLIFFEYHLAIFKVETIAKASKPQLNLFLQLGDKVRANQLLHSLLDDGIVSVTFFDEKREILSARKKNIQNSIMPDLILDREFPLKQSNPSKWKIKFNFTVDFSLSFFLGLAIGVVFFLIGYAIRWVLKGYSSELVDDLNNIIEGIELDSRKIKDFQFGETHKISLTIRDQVKKIRDSEKFESIAKTTQMLAHDVRKPFSTIQMALSLIRDAKDVDHLNSFLPLIEAEINASLTSVNGLIQDVMEIGGKSNLHLEDASPAILVKESLQEVSRMFSEAETAISFDFRHTSKVEVDKVRIKRVFSNIFANACQAMKREGSLYVKTHECDGMVEFILGNVGSYIPEEDITELFGAFYTKNKSGGTGLGLAIAEKLVNAHGGEISARSSEERQTVEFLFTLPRSSETDSEKNPLPISLKDYAPAIEKISLASSNGKNEEAGRLKEKLSSLLGGRRITIGILDDEKVYREGVSKLAEVLEGVDFIEFPRPEELLIGVFQKDVQLDFVIADIDLQHEVDGFKVVDELRRHCKFDAPICFHSNRSDPEAIAKALEVGGTSFLPKPMTLEHLLRFVTDNLAIKPLS